MTRVLKNILRPVRDFIIGLKREYEFQIPEHSAKALISGKNFVYDKNPFREIFYDHKYKTDYIDAVVLDIGAHKGYYTLYSLLNGASRVWAYEPDKFNFSFLEKNIYRNKFSDKVYLFNKAVGRKSMQRDFFIMKSSVSHSLTERSDREIVGKSKIRVVSINDVLSSVVQEGGRLIVKIDAEGAEYEILPEIRESYWPLISELFIEYHDIEGQSQYRMNKHLISKGFVLMRTISDREYLFHRRQ